MSRKPNLRLVPLYGVVTSSCDKEIGGFDEEMASIETELMTLKAGIEKLKGKQGENARAEAKKVTQRDRHLGFPKQMEEDEMGCGCGWAGAGASQEMAKR